MFHAVVGHCTAYGVLKATKRLLFQLLMFMYDTRVLQSRDCLRMRAHYLYFEN